MLNSTRNKGLEKSSLNTQFKQRKASTPSIMLGQETTSIQPTAMKRDIRKVFHYVKSIIIAGVIDANAQSTPNQPGPRMFRIDNYATFGIRSNPNHHRYRHQ